MIKGLAAFEPQFLISEFKLFKDLKTDCKSRTAGLAYCHEGSKAGRVLPQRTPRFKLIKGLAAFELQYLIFVFRLFKDPKTKS
jgi:hypothetical protein